MSVHVEARGYGALLASANSTTGGSPLAELLATAAADAAPLASLDATWRALTQRRVPPPAAPAHATAPDGALSVGGGPFRFVAQGSRVTGNYADTCPDVQFEFETAAAPTHDANLTVAPFYIDRAPVSCGRFAAWLDVSGYVPYRVHTSPASLEGGTCV